MVDIRKMFPTANSTGKNLDISQPWVELREILRNAGAFSCARVEAFQGPYKICEQPERSGKKIRSVRVVHKFYRDSGTFRPFRKAPAFRRISCRRNTGLTHVFLVYNFSEAKNVFSNNVFSLQKFHTQEKRASKQLYVQDCTVYTELGRQSGRASSFRVL